MLRTNRYPNGQPRIVSSKAGTTTYKRRHSKRGPVVDLRYQIPARVGGRNALPGKHPLSVKVRAKIAFAMKYMPIPVLTSDDIVEEIVPAEELTNATA